MIFFGAIAFQDPVAIMRKCEPAVFGITTDDLAGMGFSVAGGKYLITCDHVIGSDSKITIHEAKGTPRHGYLVFHDSKLDVAVYRLDRPAPASLKISTEAVTTGKPIFVIGETPDEQTAMLYDGTVTGISRDGDRANVLFNSQASSKFSGTPILNAKGEVIGMAQTSPDGGQTLGTGISGYTLTQFLKQQGGTAEPTKFVGKLGQVRDVTGVLAGPSPDARVFFIAAVSQYLVVDDYSDEYLKVLLANGTYGYVRTGMVDIVNSSLTSGTPGVVNGFEVMRVVQTFDSSTLQATKTTDEWLKECARFVGEVFATAGREISDVVDVQVDIGHDVATADDLQVGDRIYLGSERQLRAAIYLGNDQYISVSKEGKLVKYSLPEKVLKPFARAKH